MRDTLDMAREAGIDWTDFEINGGFNALKAFEALVRADERKQIALDKKAENARELGLDYEPADGTQVSKVWWDGEKLMAKPIPLVDFYQPVQDSTCRETLRAQGKAYPRTCRKCGLGPCIGAPKQPPAAQPAPVQEPVAYWIPKAEQFCIADPSGRPFAKAWEPLYTTPPAAQRQWVGLTDEEIGALDYSGTRAEFVKAIEAKLKELNT